MRILWFTNTPSNAAEEFNFKSFGGGWISSLESYITRISSIQLGICFFYNGSSFKKVERQNVVYYGIPFKTTNAIQRIVHPHSLKLIDEDPSYFDIVIEEFRPELIHVFGTERGYGKILMNRSEKIVFSLQGLLSPISAVYFPLGFNGFKILMESKINSIVRGNTIYHDFRKLKKMAEREKIVISHWHYYIGRTDWDRNYIGLINPEAKYFHCDEMLRKEFFSASWVQPSQVSKSEEIVIGTTINTNLFKGIDLIYKVLELLTGYRIRWKVFGIKREDRINKMICKVLKINPENVTIDFHDQVGVDDLISQLKTCHFFVHPSYIDNSPNSVCEAMLLGIPVLTSSVGGIKSLVKDGETGFLFNPYDKYDLAGLIVNLLDDYQKAIKVGIKAREVAIKRHSPETIIPALGSIYNQIINDK